MWLMEWYNCAEISGLAGLSPSGGLSGVKKKEKETLLNMGAANWFSATGVLSSTRRLSEPTPITPPPSDWWEVEGRRVNFPVHVSP